MLPEKNFHKDVQITWLCVNQITWGIKSMDNFRLKSWTNKLCATRNINPEWWERLMGVARAALAKPWPPKLTIDRRVSSRCFMIRWSNGRSYWKPGSSFPRTLNTVGERKIEGSSRSKRMGSRTLYCHKQNVEGIGIRTHRIYDFRLHRIQVSPMRRKFASSLFNVSKTVIIGILKQKPGRRLSSLEYVLGQEEFSDFQTDHSISTKLQMLHSTSLHFDVPAKSLIGLE